VANINLRSAPFVLLDDSRAPHMASDSFLFHSPDHIITAQDYDALNEALMAIDAAYAAGFHLAGWISYEAAVAFEPRLKPQMSVHADKPLIWMMATHHRERLSPDEIVELFHQAACGNERCSEIQVGKPASDAAAYLKAVKQVQDYIEAGDVYQINLTFPLPVSVKGDPLALYQKLRRSQPVPYGAYIDTGTEKILSLSPELFAEKLGGTLTAQPMKGTAPRGRNEAEDKIASNFLKNDEKSNAENLMIVDLIRNDLSRIALPGSVSVTALFETEKYPTLHQMTSTVKAQAKTGLMPSELLAAMFPCGSVTGAPKVRAMEIIQQLEVNPRGIYCGTIGHFSPASDHRPERWALNVPIRTLCLKADHSGRLSIGSGIVADSDAEAEYEECLLKARFAQTARPDFSLIETLRLEPKGYLYLDRHLDRLKSSACYFNFAYDYDAIKQALADHAAAFENRGTRRCRLLMDPFGHVCISSSELKCDILINQLPTPDSQNSETVCLSETPVDSRDVFLQHKTTHRNLYTAAYEGARNAGHADILFFNEQGLLTEGAVSSIFVRKNKIWHTPPTTDGLLPGIMRAELLAENNNITERSITRTELLTADAIYIGSALRGLRLVKIVPESM